MESLTDEIERFVKRTDGSGIGYVDDGDGSGDASGCGNDNGRGHGNGSGNGNGEGGVCGFGCCAAMEGDGDGYGSGRGNGSGDAGGSSCGYGECYGNGYGYGSGRCDGILSYCGKPVYYIDGIPTVIQKAKGNLAKGYVINGDLTTKSCYIVKGNGYFAHGDTFRDAQAALRAKIFENMDTEEAIDEFLKTFKLGVKYPAKDFYEWHHILTGSCEFGRNTFVKNHGIDLEHDTYTIEEFIEITKNDFGSDVIGQLAERVRNEK